MREFRTLLNASQLTTFEELPQELRTEIEKQTGINAVLLFEIKSFEILGKLHLSVYIETEDYYYVFAFAEYRTKNVVSLQSIHKPVMEMFALLKEGGVC
ncbi:hypothetical protein M3215_13325 [Bacillus cytotoxicus]|uniref:Uncharacterized protein n=1 Tax=Bacillus cytotoxicus TaxID=580165 RepID=A0ACC6A7Z7_9BACI|nr:hypothetical protein [Bacillus cytotoxicus]